ncbi:SDR family NAD(P)-dependent oxidoreductase, partial [uncultured Dokdonia sp.]|uniref:SDR family NAD(P)-dependent oxidoreductase n=1 Tax=uncultured Dokdonia sp. TaxID=575653 RepID=UPI002631E0FA
IRSAFLRKSTKQKFSLLTLVFLSIFIIVLSGINFTPIKKLRIFINEIVYRSSFVISIPENFIVNSYLGIKSYSNFYDDYKDKNIELNYLRSKNISSKIIISENNELKNLIGDYTLSSNKILAKVIVDHMSPFLRTVIINKGSSEGLEIGTNIYDKNYLVGRVIEVNYKSSRVLLLSDLNSNVPISITPGNIQAIMIGNGENSGEIKYIKDNLVENIKDQSIAYTSGTGSIFKSGIPIGKISIIENRFIINFFSDFDQLKYVFVEINQKKINESQSIVKNNEDNQISISSTEKIKLDILNDLDCHSALDCDIDILVNNAGIGHSGPVGEMPVGLIREVMETNVFSTLQFSQPFIREMVKKGKGKVVFVSSVAGLTTSPYLGAYNASKHALESIAQSLRDELHQFGVEVATINPGPFETGFNDRMYDTFEQWHDEEMHFTKKETINKASKMLLDNQLDPQVMIDEMVEVISQDKQAFRTIVPKELEEQCKEYQKRQYNLHADQIDDSKS